MWSVLSLYGGKGTWIAVKEEPHAIGLPALTYILGALATQSSRLTTAEEVTTTRASADGHSARLWPDRP
jgi:hypothetical protein